MAFFEELDVWQQAKSLTITIYKDIQTGHDYGFKDQIQRASVSIMNNIAEGSESGTVTNYIHFLNIAKGSCAEVRSMLYLADELNYCEHTLTVQSIEQCKRITGSINKLINYLNSRK
jgi:four helix bundle protein